MKIASIVRAYPVVKPDRKQPEIKNPSNQVRARYQTKLLPPDQYASRELNHGAFKSCRLGALPMSYSRINVMLALSASHQHHRVF